MFYCMNTKNQETDMEVNAEDQRSKAAKPPERSEIYQGSGEESCVQHGCRLIA